MAVLLDDWMDGHMSGDGMNEHFPFPFAHENNLLSPKVYVEPYFQKSYFRLFACLPLRTGLGVAALQRGNRVDIASEPIWPHCALELSRENKDQTLFWSC